LKAGLFFVIATGHHDRLIDWSGIRKAASKTIRILYRFAAVHLPRRHYDPIASFDLFSSTGCDNARTVGSAWAQEQTWKYAL